MAEITRRYGVVTGANKGIGFEICRQLLSEGITVVLTARDEKRGLEAVDKLKKASDGVSDRILFHQLQVADLESIASLAQFIMSQFGKLDILVNNAGISGSLMDADAFKASVRAFNCSVGAKLNLNKIMTQNYEIVSECVETNYYGTKRTTEALIHLLQLSDSPRIVNVSSALGKLTNIPNEWAKGILNDVNNLTEEKIDEVLNVFLEDFKQGSLEAKDINCNTGLLTVEEGAESLVKLVLLPSNGPSGQFFVREEMSSF